MKKYIILLLSVFILITGCKNNSVQKPLSEEELLKLDTQELSVVLSPELAPIIANIHSTQNRDGALENRLDIAKTIAQTAIEFKYGKNPSSEDAAQIEKDTIELKNILFRIIQRRVENEKLQKSYLQTENQLWRKKLPLHRTNLTFRSPRGQRPFTYKRIDCPTTIWGSKKPELVCYQYWYREGTKSIFYLLDDVLYERDDFDKGTLQARYLFFVPPFYNETRTTLLEPALIGRVDIAHLYQDSTLPSQELNFESDGIIGSKLVRDFNERTTRYWGYDSDHRFNSFNTTQLDQMNEGKSNYQLNIQIIWPVHITQDTPRRYAIQETKNGQIRQHYGTWKENDKGATVLDIGLTFPPAIDEPRAPVYCKLYPKGCKKK